MRPTVGSILELLGLWVMACAAASAQQPPKADAKPLPSSPTPAGQIIGRMACISDPDQTYALYLPSQYSPAKSWPIIYTFDPEARGVVPVRLYRDTAEKYGYIIAASNNSRNFQSSALTKSAQAIWDDTHARFQLDARRIYAMGFSGGARVATTLAVRCAACAIAGVISHGAGYPNSLMPSEKDTFLYLGFIGDKDFNWPEMMELRRKREQWHAPFRLQVYDGEHQWAPPEVFDDGIAWIQLKAMQAGSVPPDSAFIAQLFAQIKEEAEAAARRKDAITEMEGYLSLTSDFSGLMDVSSYKGKLAALENSPELKQALKRESEAIEQQRAVTQELSLKLAQIADADLNTTVVLRSDIVSGMSTLQNRAAHAKNEESKLILLRSFNAVWVQGIESGQVELEIKKRPDKARIYFEVMSSAAPNEPWPMLLLAETSAVRRQEACAERASRGGQARIETRAIHRGRWKFTGSPLRT